MLLSCLAAHAQSQPPPAYAITHAKIFTLAGAPIEDGTLVIRDGKIAAVGANVEVPAGAQVIDAKGLQVYPGLFDPVTQMGLSEISAVSATVDSTETGNYNPDVVAATAVSPSSEHIPVTRAAGITEVLAVPASGGFDSAAARGRHRRPGLRDSSRRLDHGRHADQEERRHGHRPGRRFRPAHSTSPRSREKKNRTPKPSRNTRSRSTNSPTGSSAPATTRKPWGTAVRRTIERDLKLEALAPVVRGQLPVLVFADRARDIRNAVEFCDKQKLKMILAGGEEAYKVKDLLRSKEYSGDPAADA